MRIIVFIAALALLSCGQNTGKEKQSPKDSLKTGGDSTKTTGQQSTVIKDSLPTPGAPDEAQVNELLNAKSGGKWHVVTDKEAKWEEKNFEYYLTDGRKKDPNYPFIIKGDFNGDNKMDYAAVVTDNQVAYDELNTRIAILPAEGSIVLIDENSSTHTALTTVPKLSTIEGYDEKDDEKKVKVKYDAIEVNNHDAGGYYIYWNGAVFKLLWSEG